MSFNLCFGFCSVRAEEQSAGPSSSTATKRRIMTEVGRNEGINKNKKWGALSSRTEKSENWKTLSREHYKARNCDSVTPAMQMSSGGLPRTLWGTSSAGGCSGSSKLTGHPDPVYVATCCNLILHFLFISLHLGKELFAKVEIDLLHQLLCPILPQFSSAAPAPADRLHSDSCCIFK